MADEQTRPGSQPQAAPAPAPEAAPSPAPKKAKSRASAIRPIVLLLVAGTIAYFGWRYAHRKEGYTGGPVTTTGTIDAVHVQLSFKVPGRLAEVPVVEGQTVAAGQVV